ncbi:hypothetical protein, partial [uncultured Halomonas sp.]|uniref:hypothetical protein n=1 Tax=uncultured Halomonas sp. TaxID=173971 RepID=UPI00260C9302
MNAAKPAFTWADVTQQPEFQNADQAQREEIQLRYFQKVVAPSIPQSQYRELRDAFFESTLPDVEVKQPGLLRRSMDAAGNLAGAVSDRLRPEEPVFDTLAWQEVESSEAFQQGDTRARHDLRQQFFRDNVAGDLQGDERREAERAFFNATDIRGTVEGSDWRPDRQGERRGLDTWESGSTGRAPVENVDARAGSVEEAVGLARSGAAGAIGSVGAATEGWGAILQQADNVEANRRVADAERRLLVTQQNMEEALAGTNDQFRDQVRENFERDLARRESELFDAINEWAEREPSTTASWLMSRGMDLRNLAQEVDIDPESRTFFNDMAGGIGSMLTYLGPGMVANALTRGSMAAGMAVSLGMATPSGVSEAYNRAIDAGLSEEEALRRSMAGSLPGAIQVAPLSSLIKGVPPHMRGKALGELYGMLRTGVQEGVVEGLGQIGQNQIERFYNPDRELTEGAGYAALVGAASGTATHGLTTSSREFALGDQGRLGQAMQAEADGLQFMDDADALARQALDPEGAQMRQIEPGTPEWEAQWRAHEQQHDLDPIDLQQPTGISATISPGAPAGDSVDAPGLRQDTPAQAAQAEDALTGELLRTPADESAPEITRAQQSLAMGDGFAFLWERAGGDLSAQESLNRMQQAYL